jgi:hypothetical protein
MPSFRGAGKAYLQYTLVGLDPGSAYFVRVAAVNKVGVGKATLTNPEFLEPGSKPGSFPPNTGASLSIFSPEVFSAAKSSTSLVVEWQPPLNKNGFDITEYLIEYWTLPGTEEIQQVSLSHSGDVGGTFTLSYGDESTISLPFDASAQLLQNALSSLNAIRTLHVEKAVTESELNWTVTFMSANSSVARRIIQVSVETDLVDTANQGNEPRVITSVISAGSMPSMYKDIYIPVTKSSQQTLREVVFGLVPDQEYFFQISAGNKLGLGISSQTSPTHLSPPKQKPDLPSSVLINVHSSQSLEVAFKHPESDGGDYVSQYKIEWDSKESFDSNDGSPLDSDRVHISPGSPDCDQCTFIIAGLVTGKAYYVRVYAYNSFGYSSLAKHSSPPMMAPKTQARPPSLLQVAPLSDTSARMSFPASLDNGGQNITKYRLEWITLRKLDYNLPEKSPDCLHMEFPVQTISITTFQKRFLLQPRLMN